MPERSTVERAKADKRQGKAPSTQAGEFIREEMHHIREGKHGASSSKQAIAIGLSKARRAGVDLPTPTTGGAKLRRKAAQDEAAGRHPHAPAPKRSRATLRALKRKGTAAASPAALSRHAKQAASRRPASARKASARKAARTRAR